LPKANHEITSEKVRLIGADGEMIGVVGLQEARKIASQSDMDLVEISPTSNPPVCRVMDFGKYKYALQKKAHEAKKKQKLIETKEIKLRPNIADGDYGVKLRNARNFLQDGNKVRVTLAFRGREITHDEVGFAIIKRFRDDLADIAKIELEPKLEGKQIFMVASPSGQN
jgi:translation initiation factor IF-3